MQQIVDPQRFQHENNTVHVRPLDFGDRILLQLMRKRPFRIKTKTRPGLRPTGPSRPLRRLRLRDRSHYERFNARPGVVGLLLAKPGINHIANPVDGQRRLSDVRTYDNFPRVLRSGLEDLGLLLAR